MTPSTISNILRQGIAHSGYSVRETYACRTPAGTALLWAQGLPGQQRRLGLGAKAADACGCCACTGLMAGRPAPGLLPLTTWVFSKLGSVASCCRILRLSPAGHGHRARVGQPGRGSRAATASAARRTYQLDALP